jgi:hypothetical protein
LSLPVRPADDFPLAGRAAQRSFVLRYVRGGRFPGPSRAALADGSHRIQDTLWAFSAIGRWMGCPSESIETQSRKIGFIFVPIWEGEEEDDGTDGGCMSVCGSASDGEWSPARGRCGVEEMLRNLSWPRGSMGLERRHGDGSFCSASMSAGRASVQKQRWPSGTIREWRCGIVAPSLRAM